MTAGVTKFGNGTELKENFIYQNLGFVAGGAGTLKIVARRTYLHGELRRRGSHQHLFQEQRQEDDLRRDRQTAQVQRELDPRRRRHSHRAEHFIQDCQTLNHHAQAHIRQQQRCEPQADRHPRHHDGGREEGHEAL